MPYYSGADPTEMQAAAQNQFYNPLTGGVNWGALVGQVYKNLQSGRDRRKAEEIEKEERMWKHALTAAQIKNLNEPNIAPREVKPTSIVSKDMVRSLMKRLEYPDEAIAEVETMNEPALAETFKRLQDDFSKRGVQGARVPRVATTDVGKKQWKNIDSAVKLINAKAKRYESAWTALTGRPDLAVSSPGRAEELNKIIRSYEKAAGELEAMKSRIDDEGELSPQDYAKLQSTLKVIEYLEARGVMPPSAAPKKYKMYANGPLGRIGSDDGMNWFDEKGNPIK